MIKKHKPDRWIRDDVVTIPDWLQCEAYTGSDVTRYVPERRLALCEPVFFTHISKWLMTSRLLKVGETF